jgi:serine/threonine protein kinase/Tfp pilus assembly protein PilF
MTLEPGTRIGPFEIVGVLGTGGMGEVYKARDTRLDRTVAIKVLPEHASGDAERRARFEREAKTVAGLNHPNICTLHDVGEHQGSMFLVMEHVTGETLADRLLKGPLPPEEALSIATDIADALAAAHRQGIVHRDLKPGNVMLTKGRGAGGGALQAKLLDFGLAKLKGQGPSGGLLQSSVTTAAAPATEKGTILGTLPYMAPEQMEGKEADARSDIFSFGAVLFEMMTGRRAFEGTSSASVISAVMSAQPPPMSTLQPLAPPALERVVTQCLAKSPDDRWQTAHDLAEELRWIGRPADTTAGARPRSIHRRPRWLFAAVMALVVLAAAGAALWLSGVWKAPGARAPTAITFIAVLPLENLSGDASQDFFADGLTDSLSNELAQIRSLKVVSSFSAMRFKGSRKPIDEIARELNNVQAVVAGTVVRGAKRVEVTVQLIDTATQVQLWSRSYEREISDILALRREIARSVAVGIRAAVRPEEERRLQRRETVRPEAFDAYLQAIQSRSRGGASESRMALESARKAVSLDPEFAGGYVQIAMASSNLWWMYYDRSSDRVEEARSAADKALALDPDSAEAHRAKGALAYRLDLDYDAALRELLTALDLQPSDSESLFLVGAVKRRQGKTDEAVTYLERALAVDPLSALVAFNLGETLMLLRRADLAERRFDEALRLNPAYGMAYAYKLRWRLRLRPELAQARDVERQAVDAGLGTEPSVFQQRVLLRILGRDYADALRLLESSPVDAFDTQFWFMPRPLLQAQVLDLLGERATARQRYAEAQHMLETKLRAEPGEARYHSALGLALAGLGQKAAAIRQGRDGVDAMPVTREAYRGAYRLEDLARIYAAVGELDAAVEVLNRLMTMPFGLAPPALALDPVWAPLRGHPGFEQLVASSKRP